MPTQIVIKNDEKMDSSDYIALTEKISEELKKVGDVKTVRSATRPTGSPISDFYISNQVKSLGNGLDKSNSGIIQISDGLEEASSQLTAQTPKMKKATDGISSLIDGTNQLKNGMMPLKDGLTKIEDGLQQGSAGSAQLKDGLTQIKSNSEQLLAANKQLLQGYQQAYAGLGELTKNYQGVADGVNSLHASLINSNQYFVNLESQDPTIQLNPNYHAIKLTVQGAQNATDPSSPNDNLATSLSKLNAALSGAGSGLGTANANFEKVISGQEQIIAGMQSLITGIDQQQAGLDQMSTGQGQIISNLSKFSDGLSGVNSGQQQLRDGFSSLSGQMDQLTNGLNQSVGSLNQVSKGLNSAQDYLAGVSKQKQNGFYIPQEVLDGKDFAKVLNTYMSNDRKVMTLDVIFTKNPYSNDAIKRVPEINQAVMRAVKGTKLENAQVAIGGVTSIYHDLNTISEHDYSRTVVLMLIGIGIILMILLRSLIMPLYLIGSLVLTYYTSMAISETIFVDVLGYTGISWAVPFFAFVILIALGIDYSIFLMDRFNEYRHLPVEQAIWTSMKKMGTVIISAAIILGGTFAAMMPSGVLSLLEIATILLIGLTLYALFILPLFVPVMVKTFGNANWWPFNERQNLISQNSDTNLHS